MLLSRRALAGWMLLAVLCAGAGPAGANGYDPVIIPGDFVAGITNPFAPFTVGKTWTYEGDTEDGTETVVVTVTDQTREIVGVTCTVVRDMAYLDGELIEDTFDWLAQHKNGDLWYFGEDAKEYENGIVVSTEGSWEAGVDDAKPGIWMKGTPLIGDEYRQEYYEGEAEDMAKVLSLSESVVVPYGAFTNCLKTEDWTPLEPGVIENKFYAAGVGLLLETNPEGESLELISVVPEPATLGLLLMGGGVFAARRKRR